MGRRHGKKIQEIDLESFIKSAKPIWSGKTGPVWNFYCPYCAAERRIPYRAQPGGGRHFLQVGLTAAFFTCITWPWLSWKGIVSFLPLWAAFEAYYRLRVRAIVCCPHCGFDPYLYLTDVQKARAEIESCWRKRFAEKGIPYPEKRSPVSQVKNTKPDVVAQAEVSPKVPTGLG